MCDIYCLESDSPLCQLPSELNLFCHWLSCRSRPTKRQPAVLVCGVSLIHTRLVFHASIVVHFGSQHLICILHASYMRLKCICYASYMIKTTKMKRPWPRCRKLSACWTSRIFPRKSWSKSIVRNTSCAPCWRPPAQRTEVRWKDWGSWCMGPGGCGKSVVTRAAAHILRQDGKGTALTAPTGLAVFNINGVTLRSSLLLPVSHKIKSYGETCDVPLARRVSCCKTFGASSLLQYWSAWTSACHWWETCPICLICPEAGLGHEEALLIHCGLLIFAIQRFRQVRTCA